MKDETFIEACERLADALEAFKDAMFSVIQKSMVLLIDAVTAILKKLSGGNLK